jgi:membrane protein
MTGLLTRWGVPLTWREVLRRSFAEALFEDDCLGMSAQLAYYFFFSLFPTLLCLLAIASYFPLTSLVDRLVAALSGIAPPDAISIVVNQIHKISSSRQGGLLTLGMLVALWTSSTAMTAIIETVNRAYDVDDSRPWWQIRLTAIALTIVGAIVVLLVFALIIVGPELGAHLAAWFGLSSVFTWSWTILQWPVAFVLASLGTVAIYYFAPDAEQHWSWLTPGAIFATFLWFAASLGFRVFVSHLGTYTETYGALGGVMVLLLWFYISGFVLLIGAEVNAVIEHASSEGKGPGEKVAGEHRRFGPTVRSAVQGPSRP